MREVELLTVGALRMVAQSWDRLPTDSQVSVGSVPTLPVFAHPTTGCRRGPVRSAQTKEALVPGAVVSRPGAPLRQTEVRAMRERLLEE